MRKNRLIALIGTLTMAAAGLAAVSAGVSSKKADGVSAATETKNNIVFVIEDQCWATNDSRDPYLHLWDISVDSSMGYDTTNLKSEFESAGVINDFEQGCKRSLNDDGSIDTGFTWSNQSGNYRYWTLRLPWYITGFKYKIVCGSNWSKNENTVSGSGSYMNYLYGEWNSWNTSLGSSSSSGEPHTQNVDKYAISATASPSAGGTATVKGNGGSAVASGNYLKRQKITAKATANSGYAFSSWSDSGTAEHTFYASEDVALTANFTANSYTVTLNANEGTGGPASVTATYGAAMPSLSSLPTKEGYIFDGYWDSATAGTQYYADNGTSAKNWDKASTATLYAHWTPNPKTPYTVKHYQQNTDLSTYSLSGTDSLSGTTGTQTNAEARSTAGFTAQPFSQQTIAADGSTEVNINYNRILYTMTYDYGEATGEITPPKENDQIYYGCTPTQSGVSMPQPEWSGHDFNGWKYTDYGQDLTINNNTPYTIAENITVHAQWSLTPVSSYSVSFVIADGQSSWGSLSSSTGSTTLSVAADSTISVNNNVMTIDGKSVTATPAADSSDGHYSYKFDSFSPNSGTIDADTTITVSFEQNVKQYSLVWSLDGGSTEESYTAGGTYDWGKQITVPSNLSRTGYDFGGLFFDSGFTDRVTGNFSLVENTTVYAKFTGSKYNVNVAVDSECSGWGTVSSSAVSNVPYGSTISVNDNKITINGTEITATPTTDTAQFDYEFSGWTGYSSPIVSAQNIKAVFTRTVRQYTISWDANGGEITSDSSEYTHGLVDYGTPIVAPEVEKDGFELNAWEPALGYSATVTGNQEYVAQWERPDGYYVHVYGANERFVAMSGTGEVSAVVSLTDGETFKVTHVVDGVETSWHGFTELKYDEGEGACDARTKAQIIDDGEPNHNMVANLPDTNSFTVYYKPSGDNVTDPGIYIPSIVNVEFDLNGVTGSGPDNQIVYSRGLVSEPEDPVTEESYEFDGWYSDAACTDPWNFSTYQVIYFSTDSEHVATQKIYAKWVSTASYNITLNNNGGTGGETSIDDVHVGDEISVSSIPEKLNQTFTGYWTEGGTKVINADGTNAAPYQESFGTTLNAGWQLNPGTYLWVKGDSAQDGARKMSLNGATGTQYVWKNITLAANDEIRCYYENGNYGDVNSITWSHPDYQGVKEGDNCKVLVAGTYDIYYDTTSGEMHLSMPTMPENGRYLVVNDDTSKDALHLMGEHQGYTGKEYLYQGYFQKDDIISAYYQDSTQATQYYPSLYESVKVWDYIADQGLKCPEAGTYSIYLISEDGGDTYNKISIFKEGEAEAVNFANTFLDKMDETCDLQEIDEKIVVNTKIEELQAAWLEMKQAFDELPNTSQAYLTNAIAVYDKDSTDKLGKFAASYDYIYGKYHASLGVVEGVDYGGDFAQRNPKLITNSRLFSVSEVSTSTWIIASVAIVGIAAVGVFFIYRKRKEI